MARTLAIGPVITAILAALRASVSLTGYVGLRVYPDSNGDVPSPPGYPYVSVESGSEPREGMDTMGGPDDLKYGSVPHVHIRVGSNTRSDAQANSISSIIASVLDEQTLTVSGFRYADCEYEDVIKQKDISGGVTIREWINLYKVTVHQ